MIIITGHVLARPESMDELRALSLDHVRRSRSEPGCISHSVHVDVENPLRLVFLEAWSDRDAVAVHFAVPESRAFVKAARELAAEPPEIAVYEAHPLGM
jgi:quinol monooxygenase YgiN